ncbi:MAG: hypothetical protein QOE92_30 [Chloroflexota bacterium]|jgi:hypothetical protein|nr:hypothetical protein [Chloroflexota bacterium]
MADAEPPEVDVQPPGQVQVNIPEQHFDILYSDQAFVSHTPVGFTIDFAQLSPQLGISRVIGRVGLSPLHLKLLVRVLSENLQHYESRYGTVPVTQEMLEQHQQPAKHIGFQPDPEGEASPS